jgi:thioredoxin 1
MESKLNMKATIELNEANFETEVLQSAQPVLVDFYAGWCGPCKALSPVLDEIAVEQAGRAKVAKVNVDQNPGLTARFGIQSIPALLYFAGGQLRHQSVGASPKQAIVARLATLGPPGQMAKAS